MATPVLEPLGPLDPSRVGRWHVIGRLGTGGMGVVYLAARDNQRAAIKVIHAAFAADPNFLARFRREVHAGEAVHGRYVARVLDSDPDGDPPWLATEYIPGPNLADLVASDGALTMPQAVALAAGLLEGLASIHAAGVVHRDLKPSNVLLTEDGPVIIDFGVASAADATSLTISGMAIGSPGWMAPEQVRGDDAGRPADVFSWGACVAFAATGRPPFGTGRAEALGYRVAHESPDLSGLPGQLQPVVAAAMAKQPGERPTVDELRGHLSGDRAGDTATLAARWDAPTTVSTQVQQLANLGVPTRRRARWLTVAFFAAGSLSPPAPSAHIYSSATETMARPPVVR